MTSARKPTERDGATERLLRATAAGDLEALTAVTATDADERLAGGIARALTGAHEQARADFEELIGQLGDRARVELAQLDARSSVTAPNAKCLAETILARSPNGLVGARALHALGLAEVRIGNDDRAMESLLEAAAEFRRLGDHLHHAQVLDSLGMLLWARGEVDNALGHFAVSLSQKALAGDRYGIALTLGNMGRVHLQCGRLHEARDCFENDLAIANELGDRQGVARMHNDLGRLALDHDELDDAESHLQQALRAAEELDLSEMVFLIRKDRVRLLATKGDLDAARRELEAAEQLGVGAKSAFHEAHLTAARGHVCLAAGEGMQAARHLGAAADMFRNAQDRPDEEIPLRIQLGRVLLAQHSRLDAEAQLGIALERATRDAHRRHLPAIREVMAELDLMPRLAQENHGRRLDVTGPAHENPDGYHLLECLGRGGFGEVHRAFDPLRHRIVAIKRLRLDRLLRPRDQRRLITAMRTELDAAQATYEHPQVARVHAVGTDSAGCHYVVQEHVEGASLEEAMRLEPHPTHARVLAVIEGTANALAVLHEHGIVHRDIKPGNVILRAPNQLPVLIDFGIAWISTRRESDEGEIREILGSPAYMAPEQLSTGGLPDPRKIDIWALGVIAYSWLSGRLPYDVGDATAEALRARILSSRPATIDNVPSGVQELIWSMLSPGPAARPDATAVSDACASLRSQLEAGDDLPE